MPKLTIDGQEVEVEPGTVLIQACEQLGIEIPRFCYHERLAIAGNCRMCLVEVSPGPPKPQASCALPCADGMVVKTNSPMVKKAREGVMEFLLLNHPLDCPICDQAGECDLQDQALNYGQGVSRYKEGKRAVEDKYMGPLIKTEMTRCIHCTRCVRFAEDIAGVPELGAFGRGEHMEVGTFIEQAITSELSGNLVDLCPVGALTSKPYAFMARPWELTKTESIDVLDAVGSNIRIDSRADSVLRILPRVHEDVNEEWISDKTRHACDGLRVQRLDRPYVRGANGKLQEATWPQAFAAIAEKVKMLAPQEIAALAGNLAPVEAVFALKNLLDSMGVESMDCRTDGAYLPAHSRGDYLFNTSISGIEQADFMLLVGTNPRVEAPLVNARIRKAWLKGGLRIASIGASADLTYAHDALGADPRVLNDILAGAHPISESLKSAKRPMIVVGMGTLARSDGEEIYNAARALAQKFNMLRADWNGFNVLHTAAGRVGAMDVGFLPGGHGLSTKEIFAASQQGAVKMIFLLGADELDAAKLGNAFVVYQGHHGDAGAHRADVILPAAAYTEQDGTYVNLEGRVQQARRAVFPLGQAKEDWAILRALSEALGKTLPYDSLPALRAKLVAAHPHFVRVDEVSHHSFTPFPAKQAYVIQPAPLAPYIGNFYMTDPISRASKTMAECSKSLEQALQARAA